MIDWQLITAIVIAAVGGLVWLVRLEGRVNLSDAAYYRMANDITAIKADLKELIMHLRGSP